MKCKYLDHQTCVRSTGEYRLCCVSLEPSNKENIHTHSIQEWHDSEFHKKAVADMDKNIWPDACTSCEQLEEKGLASQRTKEMNHHYPDPSSMESDRTHAVVFSLKSPNQESCD